MQAKKTSSHTVTAAMRAIRKTYRGNDTKKLRRVKVAFNNVFLPCPPIYYASVIVGLKLTDRANWLKVLCPFHNDHDPSLNINLNEGCFKCHTCGAKGGNIIKFHALLKNLSYAAAFKELRGNLYE